MQRKQIQSSNYKGTYINKIILSIYKTFRNRAAPSRGIEIQLERTESAVKCNEFSQ